MKIQFVTAFLRLAAKVTRLFSIEFAKPRHFRDSEKSEPKKQGPKKPPARLFFETPFGLLAVFKPEKMSKKTPLKVGITGGIGSGKTTVCRIFEQLGIAVYFADDRAKWLMSNDLDLRKKLVSIFSERAFLTDGSLDRPFLAAEIFSKKDRLEAMNAAVHPAVFADWERWQAAQKGPYALREAALLIETGTHLFLDKLIVVTAPENLRIERVVERDGLTREEVEKRIVRQLPQAEKDALADFLIQNDGSKSLVQQVWAVHRALVELSKKG